MSSTCESNCEQFSLTMFLKNIINTTVISVDQIGVVPWCIIWWFIWFFVRSVYKKLYEALLRKISIDEEQSGKLIRLYWSIAFTSITVPFTMHNLKLNYSDVIDRFYYVLENHISRWFLTDPTPSVQIKLSYVVLAGFYLNNICESCFEFGLYSKKFILNELIGLFFIATFPLRCVQYGLAVTAIINVVDFFLCLSELISCFCDIAQTKSLKFFVHIVMFFYCVLWYLSYLYILPTYLMVVPLHKMRLATDVRQISMYILLNASLFGHYVLVFFTSPASTMIYSYVITSRLSIFSKSVMEDKTGGDERSREEELALESERKKKENLLKLYHTVKCVIRIKRKLARMRKEKKTERVDSNEDICSPDGEVQMNDDGIEETLSDNEVDSAVDNVSMPSGEVEEGLIDYSQEEVDEYSQEQLPYSHNDDLLLATDMEVDLLT